MRQGQQRVTWAMSGYYNVLALALQAMAFLEVVITHYHAIFPGQP